MLCISCYIMSFTPSVLIFLHRIVWYLIWIYLRYFPFRGQFPTLFPVPDEVVAGSGCAVAGGEVGVADDGVVLGHLGAARRDHELAAHTETWIVFLTKGFRGPFEESSINSIMFWAHFWMAISPAAQEPMEEPPLSLQSTLERQNLESGFPSLNTCHILVCFCTWFVLKF